MERPYIHGESHGLGHEWFDDGSQKCETVFEFGVMMRREVRDRQGIVTEVFQRQPSDVLYQNVLHRRSEI